MEHIITCTTEELALLVTLCGYPSIAKSIAEASVGEKSEQEWLSIMEVTVHQLMVKQYWDSEKDKRGEIPLSDDMQKFITSYVQSNHMIRCSNRTQSNILLLHSIQQDPRWYCHIIERDIIHQFSYLPQEEIAQLIQDFYDFPMGNIARPEHFRLTDKAFDLLSDPSHLAKVKKLSKFTPEEETSFQKFTTDLNTQKWSLYNISLFYIPSLENDPLLQNIVFFLPSSAGVWVVEYTDERKYPVSIRLSTNSEWNELLHNVGDIAIN